MDSGTTVRPVAAERHDRVRRLSTDAGLDVEQEYGAKDWVGDRSPSGKFPFTRGNRSGGYRDQLWVRDLYAGFGNAEEARERFESLMEGGASGVSIALDLPTQLGYDSDDPEAVAEVGKVGLAVDSLPDLLDLFSGVSLAEAGVVFTVGNGIGPWALAMFELLGEGQGADPADYVIHLQNDPLKEFTGRGAFIFPIDAHVRLSCDVLEYVAERGHTHWNPIGVCGSQYRWGGGSAIHEVGLGMAAARVYIEELLSRGLDIDSFAPLLEMHLTADQDILEEAAKFRAARTLWARMMRDDYGAKLDESLQLRISLQTAGYRLTAQEPLNNSVRVTLQALSAVLGGVERIGTLAIDEALSTPSPESARLAAQTQNILAYETSIPSVADPLGGSWYVESLTDRMIDEISATERKVKDQGGTVAAIRNGYLQRLISEAAYRYQCDVEEGKRHVVGVNAFAQENGSSSLEPFRIDKDSAQRQIDRVRAVRAARDEAEVQSALSGLQEAARGETNLVPPIKEACLAMATIGEIYGCLREIFGTWETENVGL